MTPGAMRDVEADEVFVVLAGAATVEFEDPALAAIELRPGSVVRLDRRHAHGLDGARDAAQGVRRRLSSSSHVRS